MAAQNGEPVSICQGEICPMENNGPRAHLRFFRHALSLGSLIAALAGPAMTDALAAPRDSVASVTSRPGITQGYYLIEPEGPPRAIAIVFIGGEGELNLEKNGPAKGKGNFLMRVRDKLAAAGLLLAYPDTPSDQSQGYGSFRADAKHAEDIAAVVKAVKARADLPVFLIGTSRGTISATNGAARLPPGTIAGLVLTSTVTERGKQRQVSVYETPVKDIKVPVFALANTNDGCYVTPPGAVPALLKAMASAPRKDAMTVTGGSAGGDPCGAQSAHGYLGIEDQAVKAMTDWIDSVLKGP
jgi:hypothetical protein